MTGVLKGIGRVLHGSERAQQVMDECSDKVKRQKCFDQLDILLQESRGEIETCFEESTTWYVSAPSPPVHTPAVHDRWDCNVDHFSQANLFPHSIQKSCCPSLTQIGRHLQIVLAVFFCSGASEAGNSTPRSEPESSSPRETVAVESADTPRILKAEDRLAGGESSPRRKGSVQDV